MRHLIEGYSTIDEQAHINGVALIPRISRNDNLYTKQELKRFDNVKVPLSWEHDPSRQIGSVTFHYNPDLETVYYDGFITDEAAANLARNKTLFTSIEADPTSMREICNGPDDCFSMPFGLIPVGLALTETPGVPETSVNVLESIIKECARDRELEKRYGKREGVEDPSEYNNCADTVQVLTQKCLPETEQKNDDCVQKQISKLADEEPDMPDDQRVAIAFSKCGLNRNEKLTWMVREFVKMRESIICPDCGKLKNANWK